MIYKNLNNAIIEALKINNWDPKKIFFSVQKVQRNNFGELFSNVALIISNKFKLNIDEVSKKIFNSIDQKKYHFKKITIINGYLNFFYETKFLNNVISEILNKKENFGKSTIGIGKRINYEWVSANPTGYLHIGHARNVIVGDCITKIFKFIGYEVDCEYYINDAGLQVFRSAKSVYYYYSKLINESFSSFEGMYKNLEVVHASKIIFEKHFDKFKNLKWLEQMNPTKKENEFSFFVQKFFLKEIKKDCDLFNVDFNIWFYESFLYKKNKFKNFKKQFIEKKISYEKDGALWLKAKEYGSPDDFVLVKSGGEPTYFAGDIMYHDDKYNRGYDLIFNLWGTDHFGHFKRIKAGLIALGWDENKFDVNFIQMVRLIDSKGDLLKLSKRKGNTIYLRDIVKNYGLDFLRFMMISRKRSTDFTLDLSLLKEESTNNPLYYVQYAYARGFQLIQKLNKNILIDNYLDLNSDSEKELILNLYQFKIVVQNSAKKQEPQLIVDFLIQLSKKFHAFYQNNRILGIDKKLVQQKIDLVKSFLQVMKNSFNLIGITPIEKM